MKPNGAPESYRLVEQSGKYEVDFVADTPKGVFKTSPNFFQKHLLGQKMTIGRMITLQEIQPEDAAMLMEGILDPLERYMPATDKTGRFRRAATGAKMFDFMSGEIVDISKIKVWEMNPKTDF